MKNQWLMFILVILLLVVTILIHYFTHLEEYGMEKKPKKSKSQPVTADKEKENKMTKNEMKIRYNELMRIAKGDEFMSMTEFEELLALTKKLAK